MLNVIMIIENKNDEMTTRQLPDTRDWDYKKLQEKS